MKVYTHIIGLNRALLAFVWGQCFDAAVVYLIIWSVMDKTILNLVRLSLIGVYRDNLMWWVYMTNKSEQTNVLISLLNDPPLSPSWFRSHFLLHIIRNSIIFWWLLSKAILLPKVQLLLSRQPLHPVRVPQSPPLTWPEARHLQLLSRLLQYLPANALFNAASWLSYRMRAKHAIQVRGRSWSGA